MRVPADDLCKAVIPQCLPLVVTYAFSLRHNGLIAWLAVGVLEPESIDASIVGDPSSKQLVDLEETTDADLSLASSSGICERPSARGR